MDNNSTNSDSLDEIVKTQIIPNMEKVKAIITDLDNTLWTGTIVTNDELVLNKDYYNKLYEAHNKGVQIYIVSKNNEKSVNIALEKFNIDKNMFTKIYAEPELNKYLTIENLLNTTQIKPETAIFVDDNTLELMEAKKRIPTINILPAEQWSIINNIAWLNSKEFETQNKIEERKNRYRTAKLLETSIDNKNTEFLKSLNMKVHITKINEGTKITDENYIYRFANIFHKTHRLNFNPYRYKEEEGALPHILKKINSGAILYAVSVTQEGTSLGLSGALIVETSGKTATISEGTFSCGIIGRGYEQKTIAYLMQQYKNKGFEKFAVDITPTETNERMRDLLTNLGFKKINNSSAYEKNLMDSRFNGDEKLPWIKIDKHPASMIYEGILEVKNFFDTHVKTRFEPNYTVLNLGSARGEVLGLLEENTRKEFDNFLSSKNIIYTPVDMDPPAEKVYQNTIKGNAENLANIIKSNSQDIVMAIELLEHTENYVNVINEMIRVCKPAGYIFVTVPSNDYAKHEYPIDKWRIGPDKIKEIFSENYFNIINLETKGPDNSPWRTMVLVQKISSNIPQYKDNNNGIFDVKRKLMIYK
jgi:FkbH-like protein